MDMSSFNHQMPIALGWAEIGLRIAATLIAGVFLGVNRERGGHPPG
jgi:putative Mg2+ transporter-C (MgtC) family protein